MQRLDLYIESITRKNNYQFYLSLTRIFVVLLLLKKLILQWKIFPLLYMGADFFEPLHKEIRGFFVIFNASLVRDHLYIYMGIFVLFLLLFLFGFGKNLTALVVYFLYDILLQLSPQILNGGDNFFKFFLLYLVFADSFQYFSLEKYKEGKFTFARNFLSNFAGLSLCIHVCLIYFISAIHKIHADLWFSGVATYYTFNSERFNGTAINTALAKNALFVVLTTYGTVFVELFYPLLVWVKRWRVIMLVSAALLHLGIGIFMMLYDFQLIFIFVQGFFISNEQWLNVYARLQAFANRWRQRFVNRTAAAKEQLTASGSNN